MRKLASLLVAGSLIACGGTAFQEASGGGGGVSSAGGSGGASTTTTTTTTGGGGTGGTSFDACSAAGQCLLVSATCCGVCGMPTLADMVTIHEQYVEAHFAAVCADPEPCPDCPSALNPSLFAYCEAGRCAGVDLTDHPFGECVDSTDCRLRWGLECCECNPANGFVTAIPVSFEATLVDLVCEPDTACLECQPAYPPDAVPYCDSGHCVVEYLASSSGS